MERNSSSRKKIRRDRSANNDKKGSALVQLNESTTESYITGQEFLKYVGQIEEPYDAEHWIVSDNGFDEFYIKRMGLFPFVESRRKWTDFYESENNADNFMDFTSNAEIKQNSKSDDINSNQHQYTLANAGEKHNVWILIKKGGNDSKSENTENADMSIDEDAGTSPNDSTSFLSAGNEGEVFTIWEKDDSTKPLVLKVINKDSHYLPICSMAGDAYRLSGNGKKGMEIKVRGAINLRELNQEIQIGRKDVLGSNKNVMEIYRAFFDRDSCQVNLVLQKAEGEALAEHVGRYALERDSGHALSKSDGYKHTTVGKANREKLIASAKILAGILSGLSAAEEKGIIHRDLHLHNVLFLEKKKRDENDTVLSLLVT